MDFYPNPQLNRCGNQNAVPICFVSDNNFVPYLSASAQSVMDNAKSQNDYKFFVLHTNISSENQNILQNQIEPYKNFSIDFIDVSAYATRYNFVNYPKEPWYKFFIPYLFSENNYKQVVYIDADTICLTDIADILLDASNNSAAACVPETTPNSHSINRYRKNLNVQCYVNTGVIIFNTYEFQKQIQEKQLIDFAALKNWQFYEQDAFNAACNGKIKFLNLKWNVHTCYNSRYPKELKDEFISSRAAPAIIHFIHDKPYGELYISSYNKYFWIYAHRTPYFEIMLEKLPGINSIMDFPDVVYRDILLGRHCGLGFIIKCFFAWLRRRLRFIGLKNGG